MNAKLAKVEKLFMMLASNNDGEVLNAARAIDRIYPIKDLAEALFHPPAPTVQAIYAHHPHRPSTPKPPPPPQDTGAANRLKQTIEFIWSKESTLTEWERNFIRDMRGKRVSWLTQKQVATINKILDKILE